MGCGGESGVTGGIGRRVVGVRLMCHPIQGRRGPAGRAGLLGDQSRTPGKGRSLSGRWPTWLRGPGDQVTGHIPIPTVSDKGKLFLFQISLIYVQAEPHVKPQLQ